MWEKQEARMSNQTCPICKARADQRQREPPFADVLTVNCPRCGSFELNNLTDRNLREEIEKLGNYYWAITSHAVRRRFTASKPLPRIDWAWLNSVWKNERLPGPQEQVDTFINHLGKSANAPSEWAICDPQKLTGLIGTIDVPHMGQTSGFSYVVGQ
jgi:hypothetical protein